MAGCYDVILSQKLLHLGTLKSANANAVSNENMDNDTKLLSILIKCAPCIILCVSRPKMIPYSFNNFRGIMSEEYIVAGNNNRGIYHGRE